jgi:Conjugative transposon protein TcpC
MTGLLERLRPSARASRTGGEQLARLGRLVLWFALGVVLIRGMASTFATDQPAPVMPQRLDAAPTWPDDAARSFAIEFVTAYLTHSPADDAGEYVTRLEAFASTELVAELAPRFDSRAPREAVRSATVAGVARIDDDDALVTVAATLEGSMTRRMVTVPITRDRQGGLVVNDLPSFASGPQRAAAGAPDVQPLVGDERSAIVAVVTPFMRSYLGGDGAALEYLVPPGTRIAAAAGRWELIDLTSVHAVGGATREGRTVLVALQARDVGSRATYALRYRVRVVRRDRWYVAAVNEAGKG